MNYQISTTVHRTFDDTVAMVRAALAEQGFGVLTEIDLAAAMKEKLGADIRPQLILGACNPPLAYRALQAEESIGLLLPCNVVVRDLGDGTTVAEAIHPQTMVGITGNPALASVADEAAARLHAALDAVARA